MFPATEVLGLGENFVKVQVDKLWMSKIWRGEETREGWGMVDEISEEHSDRYTLDVSGSIDFATDELYNFTIDRWFSKFSFILLKRLIMLLDEGENQFVVIGMGSSIILTAPGKIGESK